MKPKTEALDALAKVWAALDDLDKPIDGLARFTMAAQVKYAHGKVQEIEELLRPRRVKKESPA